MWKKYRGKITAAVFVVGGIFIGGGTGGEIFGVSMLSLFLPLILKKLGIAPLTGQIMPQWLWFIMGVVGLVVFLADLILLATKMKISVTPLQYDGFFLGIISGTFAVIGVFSGLVGFVMASLWEKDKHKLRQTQDNQRN